MAHKKKKGKGSWGRLEADLRAARAELEQAEIDAEIAQIERGLAEVETDVTAAATEVEAGIPTKNFAWELITMNNHFAACDEPGFHAINPDSRNLIAAAIAAANALLTVEDELDPWDQEILRIFMDRVTCPD